MALKPFILKMFTKALATYKTIIQVCRYHSVLYFNQ